MNPALLAQLIAMASQLPALIAEVQSIVKSAPPETLAAAQAEFGDAVAAWNAVNPNHTI